MITFSIITVCLNAKRTMRQCLDSVANQTSPDIDYIIIDGGSSDGTLDIITEYRPIIDHFVSEPDNGIYSAMNKGIRAAKGDVLFFLNADDYLADSEVIRDVGKRFNQISTLELVYGNIVWRIGKEHIVHKQPSTITRKTLARRTLIHQTVFARKSVFEKTGGFSEQLRVVSDYEWLLKVFLELRPPYQYFDRDICVMGTDGVSWSTQWEAERVKVMRNYFSYPEILFYRTVPLKYRTFRRHLRSKYGV